MKKFLPYILIIIALVGIFNPIIKAHAQTPYDDCIGGLSPEEDQSVCNGLSKDNTNNKTPVADPNASYHLLQPLPGVDGGDPITDFSTKGNGALGSYLNLAIKLFIGLCAVAALVVIVISGIQYSASELIPSKDAARARITDALLGLIIALSAFSILYTINPDLLNTEVDIGGSSVNSSGEIPIEVLKEKLIPVGGAINPKNSGSRGTACDANVIFQASQQSGHPLTEGQAQTMSCIGGAESNCSAINANVAGVTSTAFGAFQIVVTLHGRLFDNPVCQAAAGVPAGTPLNCLSRSSLCYKAASSLACQSAVAAQLVLRQPNYRDWLQTQAPCRNARCVSDFSPGTNLHISLGSIPGRGAISDLAAYCHLQ